MAPLSGYSLRPGNVVCSAHTTRSTLASPRALTARRRRPAIDVLLLTGEYPPQCGGVADYTRELARALVVLGVGVRVLTSAPPEGSAASSQGPSDAPPGDDDPWPLARVVRSWGLSGLLDLRRRVVASGCEIAHIQYQTAAFGMGPAVNLLPLALRGGPRTVVTMHDLRVPYLFPKAGPVRTLANRLLIAAADAAILTDPVDFAAAERWKRTRRYQVPIGSNIPVAPPPGYDRASIRRRLGLGPDDVLLGYFGMLNASKGVETLVDALARLRAAGVPARLALIGDEIGAADPTNAVYRDAVLDRIDRLGLGSAVIRTGRLPATAVSAHLLALDVCVLPFRDGASFRRGSLIAALAHGLPIVTTHLPGKGAPALVDEKQAILVPPDDPAALAAAIARASSDPAIRARLSSSARQLAERFTWPEIARQVLAIYQAVR